MSDEPVWVPLQVTSGVRRMECRSETYTQIKFQGEEKSVTFGQETRKTLCYTTAFGVWCGNKKMMAGRVK